MFCAERISDRPIEGLSEAPRTAIDFGRNRASSGMGGPSPENDGGQHTEQHGGSTRSPPWKLPTVCRHRVVHPIADQTRSWCVHTYALQALTLRLVYQWARSTLVPRTRSSHRRARQFQRTLRSIPCSRWLVVARLVIVCSWPHSRALSASTESESDLVFSGAAARPAVNGRAPWALDRSGRPVSRVGLIWKSIGCAGSSNV